jgi:hypothetical protein
LSLIDKLTNFEEASESITNLLMKAKTTWLVYTAIFIFNFSVFVFHPSLIQAQVPTVQDCMGAIPVCQDIYVEENSYSGDGNYNNEIYEDLPCNSACPGSCLAGEVNSVWYIWTVQAGGILRLTIDPVQGTDDYDWAVYDVTDLRCSDIYSSYSLMQKSCNAYGSGANGNTGISTSNGGSANCNNCGATNIWNKDLTVLEGRTYVLVIENWSGTTQGYTLDFSASTAIIFDDVRPELATVLADEITCGDNEIIVEFSENVMCESVNAYDFLLVGPGGPYNILDAQGEVCLAGGTMEKRYSLIIDRPISNDGDYSVELKPLNFVYDACNNFALGNTIIFSVDLGAPVVNEFNMTINEATCGLSNGSITGLQIIGTPPYTYLWMNEQMQTVGTDLDLLNVPSGNYTLTISDHNTCQTISGPYLVDQTGAPQVDDNQIVITGANWNANNGHITGLIIGGTEPLTYLWTDSNNDSVGNAPELHDVYSGNYYLLVTDVYGCDTLGGPYFVQQIGGPIGVQAAAYPTAICMGESSQLEATGFGGTGTYTFAWASNPPGFSSDLQSPVVYPLVTTTYTVSISDGYNVTSAFVIVTVNPLPVANAGTDVTINYGTSTTLYGSVGGGSGSYHFYWEPANMLISPETQNTATKNLYATTLFTLHGRDNNSGCISLFDTVLVSLEGGPLGVTMSLQDDTICKGESTIITAFGFGGNYGSYHYKWYYGPVLLKEEQTLVSTLTVNPVVDGSHEYMVEIDDGFNQFTSTITVHVAPSPAFSIAGGPEIIACPADTVLLSPSQLYPGSTYYWSNGSTEPAIRLATTGIGFSVRKLDLTITNPEGCAFSDTITVIFDFAACFGIEDYQSFPTVNVYPNPSAGMINIEFEDGEGFLELQVLNPQGSVIYTKDLGSLMPGPNKVTADLQAFPKGVYLVRAVHEHFIHHQKLILN